MRLAELAMMFSIKFTINCVVLSNFRAVIADIFPVESIKKKQLIMVRHENAQRRTKT